MRGTARGLGTGNRGPGIRAAARRAALGSVLLLLSAGCDGRDSRGSPPEGASYRRPKNAAGRADSVRVVETARAELRRRGVTDSLVVAAFTRASNGYLVKLARASDATGAGAGTIWVDEDGSATVTQEYRP